MGKLHGSIDVITLIIIANLRHKGAFKKLCEYLGIAKGEGYEIIAGGEGLLFELVSDA
jgi:hypothetical protein